MDTKSIPTITVLVRPDASVYDDNGAIGIYERSPLKPSLELTALFSKPAKLKLYPEKIKPYGIPLEDMYLIGYRREGRYVRLWWSSDQDARYRFNKLVRDYYSPRNDIKDEE